MQKGPNEPLSERELELVQLLGQGLSNREIAHELVISPNTVKVHLRNIYAKLNVSSRTEATMVALRQGLIEIDLPQEESASGPAEAEPDQESPPAPRPPLARWQRAYAALAILLVALGLWLIWPSDEVQPGPFDVRPAPDPGQPHAISASARCRRRSTTAPVCRGPLG